MHTARNYQQAGIDEIQSFWARGGLNALYVLPTGGGKSYVMARIAAEFGRPVCAIAHRSELVGRSVWRWPERACATGSSDRQRWRGYAL